MSKDEVIKSLQEVLEKKEINLSKEDAFTVHKAVFENISNILALGHEVTVIDFGRFKSIYVKKQNMGKLIKENVKETIQVFMLKFNCSDALKNRINGKTK